MPSTKTVIAVHPSSAHWRAGNADVVAHLGLAAGCYYETSLALETTDKQTTEAIEALN